MFRPFTFRFLQPGFIAMLFLFSTARVHAQQLDSTALRRIATFSKAFGHIRYFHPSDPAAALNWNGFAMHAIEQIGKVKDEMAFRHTLQRLFQPIGAGVLLDTIAANINTDNSSRKNKVGESVTSWFHVGVGLDNQPDIYYSKRIHAPAKPTSYASSVSLCQYTSAESYAGMKIRFSANLDMIEQAGDAIAQVWIRADPSSQLNGVTVLGQPVNCRNSQKSEVEIQLPQSVYRIYVGVLVRRNAQVRFANPELSCLLTDGWQSIPLANPSFQEWQMGEPINWLFGKNSMDDKAVKGNYQLMQQDQSVLIAVKNQTTSLLSRAESEVSDQLPDLYHASIGSGLYLHYPLALSRPVTGSLPALDTILFQQVQDAAQQALLRNCDASSPIFRIANVTIAWNVLRHFFPYWEAASMPPEEQLLMGLRRAADARDAGAYLQALRQFTAVLNDGHAAVLGPAHQRQPYTIPVLVTCLGDSLIVDKVAAEYSAMLPRGAILLSIDGVNAQYYANEKKSAMSGSLQWKQSKLATELFIGKQGDTVELQYIYEGKSNTIRLNRDRLYYELHRWRQERRPSGWIKSDIFYLDLHTLSMDSIQYYRSTMQAAKAIICDLRGYPNGNHSFLEWLMREKDTKDWMFVPVIQMPEGKQWQWRSSTWQIKPDKKKALAMPIYFITDGRAISYAESMMGYVKDYQLATIVGEPTAGANGNINTIYLPGDYQIIFTGLKVTHRDGSQLFNRGIQPDYRVNRTYAGIQRGTDELLDFAVARALEK